MTSRRFTFERPGRGVRELACALALLFGCHVAFADGLLRIVNCRIVDDAGPVKAVGVNYVDGFWGFSHDGKREDYLPSLDALAEAKVPFIRAAFGPWANYAADKPASPQIADFVAHREDYFARLDTFLADAKARHIGVVLDVFWNVDPYTVYFGEPPTASAQPGAKTSNFLRQVVAELGRRHGADPTIWMVELLNEGDLDIDYPAARLSRRNLVALSNSLVAALRVGGDRHLIDSGNSLPRPAAQGLSWHKGWKPDSLVDFQHALDGENPPGESVVSIHVYPENKDARPWDDGDVLNAMQAALDYGRKTCRPLFVGEFGAPSDPALVQTYLRRVIDSGIQLAALWGFGRPANDPSHIGIDAKGRAFLKQIAVHPSP